MGRLQGSKLEMSLRQEVEQFILSSQEDIQGHLEVDGDFLEENLINIRVEEVALPVTGMDGESIELLEESLIRTRVEEGAIPAAGMDGVSTLVLGRA